jgi:hypothetical protein
MKATILSITIKSSHFREYPENQDYLVGKDINISSLEPSFGSKGFYSISGHLLDGEQEWVYCHSMQIF